MTSLFPIPTPYTIHHTHITASWVPGFNTQTLGNIRPKLSWGRGKSYSASWRRCSDRGVCCHRRKLRPTDLMAFGSEGQKRAGAVLGCFLSTRNEGSCSLSGRCEGKVSVLRGVFHAHGDVRRVVSACGWRAGSDLACQCHVGKSDTHKGGNRQQMRNRAVPKTLAKAGVRLQIVIIYLNCPWIFSQNIFSLLK